MRRGLPLIALLVAVTAACGGGPTTPAPGAGGVPASASFEGVWEIQYVPETCTGLRHCFAVLNKPSTITLRALRGSNGVDAVLNLGPGTNIDLAGTVVAGALSLRGTRLAAIVNDSELEVTRLELRRERAEYSGHFEYTARGPSNSSFFGSSRIGGPITSARFVGPVVSNGLTGAWHGRLAVRDCSSVGWPDCQPHRDRDIHPLHLSFTQEGSSVTGTLRILGATVVAVEGIAAGDSVTISGKSIEPNYAFDEVRTLRPSTLTRDAVGRLRGAISLEIAWPPKLPDIWSFKSTDYRVIELLNVALEPS